jgi:hypothetical protein
MKKLIPITIALLLGFGLGSFTNINAAASGEAVLASVEWVLSKINPLEQRINALEQKVNNLSNGNSGGTTTDPIQDHSSVIINSPTAVKKGAANQYETFFTAPKNTVLTYYSTFTNSSTKETWYIVRLSNGKLGAVKATYASVSVNPYTGSYTKVVFNQKAQVRRGASSNYEVYYTAPAGSTLTYNSTFTNSITNEKWYIVKLSDGKLGAVQVNYAEVIK